MVFRICLWEAHAAHMVRILVRVGGQNMNDFEVWQSYIMAVTLMKKKVLGYSKRNPTLIRFWNLIRVGFLWKYLETFFFVHITGTISLLAYFRIMHIMTLYPNQDFDLLNVMGSAGGRLWEGAGLLARDLARYIWQHGNTITNKTQIVQNLSSAWPLKCKSWKP